MNSCVLCIIFHVDSFCAGQGPLHMKMANNRFATTFDKLFSCKGRKGKLFLQKHKING